MFHDTHHIFVPWPYLPTQIGTITTWTRLTQSTLVETTLIFAEYYARLFSLLVLVIGRLGLGYFYFCTLLVW